MWWSQTGCSIPTRRACSTSSSARWSSILRLRAEYLALDGIEATFNTPKSRIIALLNLIRLSYADGAFEVEEECLLKEVSRAFGVEDEQFRLLDNWVRRLLSLEEEARGFMVPG